jgi:hypothetical protein
MSEGDSRKKTLTDRLEDPDENARVGCEYDLTAKRKAYNASRTVSAFLMSYDAGVKFKCMRGPIGDGKSVGMCMYIVHKSQQQEVIEVTERGRTFKVRWSKWLIMRHTLKSLADTLMETWDQWFGDKTRWVTNPIEGRYEDYAPDGVLTRIDFVCYASESRGIMNDLQSLELSGAWINEACQCPYRVVAKVFTRLKRFNPSPLGGKKLRPFHVIMDTNAPNETNWWREKEEVEQPEGWLFFVCPPAVLEERDEKTGRTVYVPNDVEHALAHGRRPAENVREVDGGYHDGFSYWMDMIGVLDEDEVRMLLQNKFGLSMAGMGIFSDLWNPARHRIAESSEEAQYKRGLPVGGGLDCGRTPSAVLGQMMPDGKLVVQREATTWNPRLNNGRGGLDRMDIVQFFDERLLPVLSRHYNWPNCQLTLFADPAGKNYNEVISMSAIQRLRQERGVNVIPCDKVQALDSCVQDITNGNSPEIRIDCVRDALRRDSLRVSEACTMFCAAMAGKYHWEKIGSARGDSAERWSDRPEKNEWSHISDSGQYYCLAMFRGATDFSKPWGGRASVNDFSWLGGGSDFGCI